MDRKAEGFKKVIVKCFWYFIVEDVCGNFGFEVFGSMVFWFKGLWRDVFGIVFKGKLLVEMVIFNFYFYI